MWLGHHRSGPDLLQCGVADQSSLKCDEIYLIRREISLYIMILAVATNHSHIVCTGQVCHKTRNKNTNSSYHSAQYTPHNWNVSAPRLFAGGVFRQAQKTSCPNFNSDWKSKVHLQVPANTSFIFHSISNIFKTSSPSPDPSQNLQQFAVQGATKALQAAHQVIAPLLEHQAVQLLVLKGLQEFAKPWGPNDHDGFSKQRWIHVNVREFGRCWGHKGHKEVIYDPSVVQNIGQVHRTPVQYCKPGKS